MTIGRSKLTTVNRHRSGTVLCRLGLLAGLLLAPAQAEPVAPETANDWAARARAKHQDKDYPGAVACYDEALRLNPDDASNYAERAQAKIDNHDAAGAVADLTRTIKLQPDRPGVYLDRGVARLQVADYEGAAADFDWALVQQPDRLDALYGRGIAEFFTKNYVEALADLNADLNRMPAWWDPLTYRARTKFMLGDFDGALADLDSAIALKPNGPDPNAYFYRGVVNDRKGLLAAAIRDYTEVIKTAPDFSPAYWGRAIDRAVQGDTANAIEDLTQLSALPGADPFYPRLHRCILLQLARRPDAIDDLAQAFPVWPDEWPKTIGLFLLRRLSEADLLAAAEKSPPASLSGQRCEARFFAGMTRLAAGDASSAQTFFRRCLETNQDDFVEYRLAGEELRRMEKNRSTR